jgi:flagellar protein FlaG
MPMETVGTSINPVVPAGSKPADTVRKPPAVPQPEVSAVQPAQDFIKRSEVVEAVKTDDIKLKNEVQRALSQVEIMMELRDRAVTFSQDQQAGGKDVIRVVDRDTGETIRQFPPEELLQFMRNLTKMLGTFMDEKA